MFHARDVAQVTQTDPFPNTYRHDVPSPTNPRGAAFAALLREARRERGWTQDTLVEASGVSRSTILRWEGGDASRPDPDQVRAVCLALGIDPLRAAVALGYLTPEDLRPSGEPRRPLDPTQEEVLDILQDPEVPAAEKAAWVEYLRYLRTQKGSRRAG